ncbi:MAG: DUF4290 domain-containing protein [Bacteroidales bacterium]|nr:DUF4290 domain-containing protein [Bacteroidales bacterium]
MEYNTAREQMIIPEYGRNVQKMVDYTLSIDDRDLRTILARIIVDVMASMNPQVKDTNDYKQKLWDHLHIISDFRLDVDSPFPVPEKKDVYSRPTRIPYADGDISYKHYGLNLEKIIKKVKEMSDGEEKEELVSMIANYMKRSYLTWNRDSVNDETILTQLDELSKGDLQLKETDKLIATSEIVPSGKINKKKKNNNNNNRGRNNNQQRQNNNRKQR